MTVAAVALYVVRMQIGVQRCLVLLDIRQTVRSFKSGLSLAMCLEVSGHESQSPFRNTTRRCPDLR